MRSGAARKAGGVVTIRKASGDRIFTEIAYQHRLAWVTDSWPQQAAIGRVGRVLRIVQTRRILWLDSGFYRRERAWRLDTEGRRLPGLTFDSRRWRRSGADRRRRMDGTDITGHRSLERRRRQGG